MQYMKLDESSRQELLEGLAAMPADIRRLFSPVEQVWHLADLETEGFGYRIEALRDRVDPVLPDFDGTAIAMARNYRSRSLEEGLARFEMNGQNA